MYGDWPDLPPPTPRTALKMRQNSVEAVRAATGLRADSRMGYRNLAVALLAAWADQSIASWVMYQKCKSLLRFKQPAGVCNWLTFLHSTQSSTTLLSRAFA